MIFGEIAKRMSNKKHRRNMFFRCFFCACLPKA
nr:MAG TPA: hypothetical protein [Caudoviricetes sp.]